MGYLGSSAEFQHIERAANFIRQRFRLRPRHRGASEPIYGTALEANDDRRSDDEPEHQNDSRPNPDSGISTTQQHLASSV